VIVLFTDLELFPIDFEIVLSTYTTSFCSLIKGYLYRKNTISLHLSETFNKNNRISETIVVRTIKRFEESGSIRNRQKSDRLAIATNENKALDVLQFFVLKTLILL